MTVNVVSIAIDKVQVFLYYAIHAQEQELQSNNNTLKSIISSSRMISDGIFRIYKRNFTSVLRLLCIYNNFAGRRNQGKTGRAFSMVLCKFWREAADEI